MRIIFHIVSRVGEMFPLREKLTPFHTSELALTYTFTCTELSKYYLNHYK